MRSAERAVLVDRVHTLENEVDCRGGLETTATSAQQREEAGGEGRQAYPDDSAARCSIKIAFHSFLSLITLFYTGAKCRENFCAFFSVGGSKE